MAIVEGRGLNRQIRRAYGWLASHYREGDRIFLFGYSRGAYAVRSLAGVIDRVGLLRREHATERGVQLAYRHYQNGPDTVAAAAFARALDEWRALTAVAQAGLSRATLDRLQATARLATVGEMASLLSHELNQPLAAIASYASGSQNLLQADASMPAAMGQQLIDRLCENAGMTFSLVPEKI